MPQSQSTILLVEDEECLRRLLARTLEDAALGVVEAENGALALQAVRRLRGALSLVVTDIKMPVMDGLEFARRFRRLEPGVPLLFVTASEPVISPEIELNPQVLLKPFLPGTFLETVLRMSKPAKQTAPV